MKSKQDYLKANLKMSFCLSHFQINQNSFIRVFGEETKKDEFEWHMDERKRNVYVVYADENWQFQNDNQIPKKIKTGDAFTIEKEFYHRIIPGVGRAVIYIEEDC